MAAPPPQVSIVLPTYKEEGSVGATLDDVATALDAAGITWEAIVVDDDSPDGTHDEVRAAAARHDGRVRLVVRTKERGLGTAVVRGFDEARGTYVAVMDADGQHPATAAVDLVHGAELEQADVVVGSRHIGGGSVGEFGPLRRLISWSATLLARAALEPVRRGRVTDPMSGLFLVRRSAVAGVALDPLGYKVLLEVLAKARPATGTRLRVAEVPYTFGARRAGESKLGAGVMVDYLRHLAKLGLADRENRRLVEFVMVGLTGVVVNLGILAAGDHFFAAAESDWRLVATAAVAREASVLNNFVLNDRWTYRDLRHRAGSGFWGRCLKFHVVSGFSGLAYVGLTWGLWKVGVHYLVAGGAAIVLSTLINFRGNTDWTYRDAIGVEAPSDEASVEGGAEPEPSSPRTPQRPDDA